MRPWFIGRCPKESCRHTAGCDDCTYRTWVFEAERDFGNLCGLIEMYARGRAAIEARS